MPPELSVIEELEPAQSYLRQAMLHLWTAVSKVDQARQAAEVAGKPTDRLEVLHSELLTLSKWTFEKRLEAIQKMAADEAGSWE